MAMPGVCPKCGLSTGIFSFYRDGGSTLYHPACKVDPNHTWPNPDWALGNPFNRPRTLRGTPQPKPMTNQELALGSALEDAVARFAYDQGDCGCRGLLMAVNKEVKALVAAVLDAKVHGHTLRKDDDGD